MRKVGAPAIRFDSAALRQHTALVGKPTFHLHGLGYKRRIRRILVRKNDKPAPNAKPRIHRSAIDLRDSRDTMVTIKEPTASITELPFLYHPPNVKKLEESGTPRYSIVR
jgi:hypothetical protein